MRFLFDQNLSPRLRQLLSDLYPNSVHVRDVGFQSADDEVIWNYAARNGLTIATKDSDFHQRSFLLSHPPKVVWIQRGNCSTTEVETILRVHQDAMESFEQDEGGSFLALS